MTIDDTQLTELALGLSALDQREALERALRASPNLQRRFAQIHAALESVALNQPAIMSGDALRQRVMQAIEPATRFAGFVERCAALFDLDAERARELLSSIDDATQPGWRASGIPGVTILKFSGGPRVANATCGLVRVKPGRLFPAHRHRGAERVLVLQGFARDDAGHLFAPGDIARWHAGSSHTLRATDDAPLVFAVALEKPNRWLVWQTMKAWLSNGFRRR